MSGTLAVQAPIKRELEAGLAFLSEKYDFTVRPYDFDAVKKVKDSTPAPSAAHAISWRKRILWLSGGDAHFEWLHEVAHLVCCPPWEDDPNNSNEFGGIFAWERAVGREFYRKNIWSKEDWMKLLDGQDAYVTTFPVRGGDMYWSGGDWGDVRRGHQNMYVSHMYRTLRLANLLSKDNRPTFAQPVWSEEVRLLWDWKWRDVLSGSEHKRVLRTNHA
jgi:hypothetical protein